MQNRVELIERWTQLEADFYKVPVYGRIIDRVVESVAQLSDAEVLELLQG